MKINSTYRLIITTSHVCKRLPWDIPFLLLEALASRTKTLTCLMLHEKHEWKKTLCVPQCPLCQVPQLVRTLMKHKFSLCKASVKLPSYCAEIVSPLSN